jgi:hypothetical protein
MEAILGRPISEIVSEIALPRVARVALLESPTATGGSSSWSRCAKWAGGGGATQLGVALGQGELQPSTMWIPANQGIRTETAS